MKKGGAALAGPIWNGVMAEMLKDKTPEQFEEPDPIDTSIPPILRGFWQGGETFSTDSISGGLATQYTPDGVKKETSITNVHTILYWINKNDPLNKTPSKNTNDPQYKNWEYGIQKWWGNNYMNYKIIKESDIPGTYDNVHMSFSKPEITITGLSETSYKNTDSISFTINSMGQNPIKKIDVFLNNTYLKSFKTAPATVSFVPKDITGITSENTLRVVASDINGGVSEVDTQIKIYN
jgi:hypothetical protein